MSTNPYSQDSSVDDDIFESPHSSHRHTFNNKPCKKHGCNVTHDVRLKDGANLPTEVEEELSRLLDSVPQEIVEKAVIVGAIEDAADMYSSTKEAFLRFAHVVRAMNSQAPMNLALFEVLDSLTQGSVTRHYIVYAAEYSLVNMHVIRTTLRSFREWLKSGSPDPLPDEDTFRAIDDLEIYIDERIEHYVRQYHEACTASDLPVDQTLLETGEPSKDRLIAREIMLTTLQKEMAILFEGKLMPNLDYDMDEKDA